MSQAIEAIVLFSGIMVMIGIIAFIWLMRFWARHCTNHYDRGNHGA